MEDQKYRFDAGSPLISVIIPVYNVEAYLRKCLESVAAQTLKNFEVIIVNDGSPDQSQKIIDEFTSVHENFNCIITENQGLGAARNTGLKLARGQYVAFIDSDDWVRNTFLEDFWDKACETEADIVCCGFYYTLRSGMKFRWFSGAFSSSAMDTEKASRKLINDFLLHHFAWNKMYRRSLFLVGEVRYPSICFEDIATTARLFAQAKKVAFVSKANYYYLQRQGSIMHNVTYRRLQEHINAYAVMRAYYDKMKMSTMFSRNLRISKLMMTHNVIGEIIQLNPEKREQSIPRDILNALRQIRAFKNKQLPIIGEPWEKLIRNTLYQGEDVPGYLNYYRDATKPYCSFYEGYDSEQTKQYVEV